MCPSKIIPEGTIADAELQKGGKFTAVMPRCSSGVRVKASDQEVTRTKPPWSRRYFLIS